ncbi:HAD family hydrolase [Candidatus Saccharibacteria bacterium]|jgi:HAD superfamily hydrolase (TIGR01549 family)|nr:HAD family hydrolase [Candidatus Saccharibacteria bacterium]
MKKKFEKIKAVFFDTSDTLYKSVELEAAYPRKLVELIAETCNISTEEAEHQLNETIEQLKETENHVTKVRAAAEFGINRKQVHQKAFCKVIPSEYLRKDDGLNSVMAHLAKYYKLGIISNLNKLHMLEVFSALGLSPEWFPLFVTEDIVNEIKPHHEPFLKAIELSGYTASECLYVGDSPTNDMRPAHEVGMTTILIASGVAEEYSTYVSECIPDVKDIIDLLEIAKPKNGAEKRT